MASDTPSFWEYSLQSERLELDIARNTPSILGDNYRANSL
jgi:hypothetical protein